MADVSSVDESGVAGAVGAGEGQATEAPEEAGPQTAPATETGEPRVDAAVARLTELDDLPIADHVAVFDDVDQRLRQALDNAEGG